MSTFALLNIVSSRLSNAHQHSENYRPPNLLPLHARPVLKLRKCREIQEVDEYWMFKHVKNN